MKMKKIFIEFSAAVICLTMTLGIMSVSAATGFDDGVVRIPSGNALAGDVNRDGEVNILDIVRMKKYISDNSIDISFEAANLVDSDYVINSQDLTGLIRLLLIK